MQPTDQDELRRQAQRALTRRIGSDTNQQAAPPRPQQPAQRPQANANRRQQQQSRDEQQLRELQERRQRQQQQQQQAPPVVEVEIREPVSRHDVHRDIHANTHAGVHQSRHQDIHAGAYARADATRRRSQIYRDLHDPEARKRAIVMAEILGKPVALREHEGNTT